MPSTLYIGYAESDLAEGEAVTLLGNSGDADLDNAADIYVVVVLNNDSGSLTADIYVTSN